MNFLSQNTAEANQLKMMNVVGGKEEEYRRVFRYLDVDGDGKISAWELRRCGMTEEEAEVAVRAVDDDGDGTLGMEAFVRMMMTEDEDESSLKEAFKMYEEEEGGMITSRSLKRMLSKLGEKKSVDQCKAIISVFDLNGDGGLSFSEFKLMMS